MWWTYYSCIIMKLNSFLHCLKWIYLLNMHCDAFHHIVGFFQTELATRSMASLYPVWNRNYVARVERQMEFNVVLYHNSGYGCTGSGIQWGSVCTAMGFNGFSLHRNGVQINWGLSHRLLVGTKVSFDKDVIASVTVGKVIVIPI